LRQCLLLHLVRVHRVSLVILCLSRVDVERTIIGGFFYDTLLVEQVSDVLGILVGSLCFLAGIDGAHQIHALLLCAVILAG
jgi:hypothetical protein